MRKVLVAGAVHIDIFADIDDTQGNNSESDHKGTLQTGIGGTAYNIARSLKGYGMEVALASALKRNSLFTRLILSRLVELGFSKEHLLLDKNFCEGGFVAYRYNGDTMTAVTASPLCDLEFDIPGVDDLLPSAALVFLDLNLSVPMVRSLCKLSATHSTPLYVSVVSEDKITKLLELGNEKIDAIFLNRLEANHLLSFSGKTKLSDIRKDTIWVVTMEKNSIQIIADNAVHNYAPPLQGEAISFKGARDAFTTGFTSSLSMGECLEACVNHGFSYVMEASGKPQVNNGDMNLAEDADRFIYTDILTKLHNRAFYEEEKRIVWNMFQRDKVIPLSVLVLDVDNFKRINDTYGHQTGDDTLKMLGRVILENIRVSDMAFRYGGEEVVVFFRNLLPEYTIEVADRIRIAFGSSSVTKDGQEIKATLSGGLAPALLGDSCIDQVFRRADEALYAAKQSGKNKIMVAPRPEPQ